MTYIVCLLPGDGIGPEVTSAARCVIEAAARIRTACETILAEGNPKYLTPDIGGKGDTQALTDAIIRAMT